MEILEEKIKNLQGYRDLYFINNSTATYEQFLKEIKNKVCDLREEIPISMEDVRNVIATNSYIQGKILNIMPEYDRNCENYLTKAIKKECTKWECWLELAICMWKKGDSEGALDCMKEAYKLNDDNSNILSEYGTVLRNQRKPELNEVAREMCLKGIKMYPNDSLIWYSYANQCLHDFYNYGKDIKKLESSIEGFEKSLSLSTSTTPLPSDFYLNFSSSFYSNGNLIECCLNLTKATLMEPHYQAIQEKISSVNNLLAKINQEKKEILDADAIKNYSTANEGCTNRLTDDKDISNAELICLLNNSNNTSSYYLGIIDGTEKMVVICDAKNLLIIDISMRHSMKKKDLMSGEDNNIICGLKLPLSRLNNIKKDSFDVTCQKHQDHLFNKDLILKKTGELFPNIHLLDNFNFFCYY